MIADPRWQLRYGKDGEMREHQGIELPLGLARQHSWELGRIVGDLTQWLETRRRGLSSIIYNTPGSSSTAENDRQRTRLSLLSYCRPKNATNPKFAASPESRAFSLHFDVRQSP